MAVASNNQEGSLQEEVELLEAIYIHELTIEGQKDRPSSICLLLHPSTGDEGEKQYVCLTLHISLPSEYPNKIPGIHIRNPRGLSDAHIESIISNLRELAESRLGSPMLYELIEYAKESLTDNNIPSCACAICLSHFQDSHCFTKTECYHYFHSSCLTRYIEYSLKKMKEDERTMSNSIENDPKDKQIVCPMCRLPITYDLEALKAAPEDVFSDNEPSYSPDNKMQQLQKEMAELFDKQFKKGGIINVEEEKNRFLIEIKKTPAPVQQNPKETSANGDRARDNNNSDTGKPTSSNNVVEQNKSTNDQDKGVEERKRERPSSSRKNFRGRGGHHGHHYKSDGRRIERSDGRRNERSDGHRNERSDGPRNERPRSSHERRFYKGQRDREVHQKTQGVEKNDARQGRNHESKTKNGRTEESKAVTREMNGLKMTNVPEDKTVQEVIVNSDMKNDKQGDNSEASFGVESLTDDKSALKLTGTQKDNIQDKKRTDSGYREKRRDKTMGRKENTPSHRNEFSPRENEPGDQKDRSRSMGNDNRTVKPSSRSMGTDSRTVKPSSRSMGTDSRPVKPSSRSMGTDSRTVKPSSPSGETSSERQNIYNDDKRRKRQNRPKRIEQKDKDGKISLSNGVQNSSSRYDVEKTKSSKIESQNEMTRIENKKSLPSDSTTRDQSATGDVRPPPGFDRIEKKSRGPTGAPPGFENQDSLPTRQPPPGF